MNKVKIEGTHSKQVLQEKILKDKHKKKKKREIKIRSFRAKHQRKIKTKA